MNPYKNTTKKGIKSEIDKIDRYIKDAQRIQLDFPGIDHTNWINLLLTKRANLVSKIGKIEKKR